MNPFSMISTLRRRWAGERGAVLVEAALAVPILLFVILGSIEAGMAWEAKSATTAGVRTGLLRAASIGDQPETDLRILQSIIGEIGADNVDGLEWVVIFDATNANHAATIESCRLAESGGGIFDTCNTYGNGTQFADIVAGTVTQANFDDGGNVSGASYVCDVTKVDSNWCAPKRLVNGDIQIGIALSYQHDWFTGIFPGDGVDFEDYSTSSTFIGEGSDITPSGGNYVAPTNVVYDSGSFDQALNLVPWSASSTNFAPNDSTRNYLGPYGGSESVQLSLSGLGTSHTQICVTFDLIVIGEWEAAVDVNNPNIGSPDWEDIFTLDVDGTEVHRSTYEDNTPPTGATEVDTLGYTGQVDSDFVVTITECVAHTGDTATFDFGSAMSAAWPHEGWALDNVEVSLV